MNSPRLQVPVLRPLLPSAERLLPYLRRLDDSRCYTNYGELVVELETRLAALLSVKQLATANSGFAAIVGCILGTVGRASAGRKLALVPGYTFVATAAAAELCGFEVVLADVDPVTWQLDPLALLTHPRLHEVGLVIPVAANGRPVPQQTWIDFQRQTGITVVIDGAASFDTVARNPSAYLGTLPVAISFHATKSFATGEGGCVICSDQAALAHIIRSLNFGFYGERNCRSPSTNGKMSEYHAAVGLAELDGWDAKLAGMKQVADSYRCAFAQAGHEALFYGSPDISANYVLLDCMDEERSLAVRAALSAGAIDFRQWYASGLRGHDYYAGAGRDSQRVSDDLSVRLLGLPFAPDLGAEQVRRVVATVAAELPVA